MKNENFSILLSVAPGHVLLNRKEKMYWKPIEGAGKCTAPKRTRIGDAGLDICSSESKILPLLIPRIVKTQIAMSFDADHVLVIKDRSSLGKRGIKVLAGVMDSNYRGEYMVILINLNLLKPLQFLKAGAKICQGLLLKLGFHDQLSAWFSASLSDTDRGEGRFGSTDV